MNGIIESKSKKFAVKIINLYKYLDGEEERICNVKADIEKWDKYRCKCQRGGIWAERSRFHQQNEHRAERSGRNIILVGASCRNGLYNAGTV